MPFIGGARTNEISPPAVRFGYPHQNASTVQLSQKAHYYLPGASGKNSGISGTPTKRQVSKRQVSKGLVSKRPVFKFYILMKQKV